MAAILGLFLGLGLLMVFAYRGFSVIFFAPVFALLAAALSGLHVLPVYTEIFLPSLAGYLKTYLPFFILGAVFGKSMEYTGAAASIAQAIVKKLGVRHAVLAVVLSCAVLTYGGVSLFVVAFAIYPFAAALFSSANIPKRLLPGTIALGAFTFTMDALPGTPQIQNAIPMKFFNTDLYAAPIFGSIGALSVFGFGMTYLLWRARQAVLKNEGYGFLPDAEHLENGDRALPPAALAVLPLIFVLGVTLLLQKCVFPHWSIVEWAVLPPYKMEPSGIVGSMNNWALILGLVCGILATFLVNPKKLKHEIATDFLGFAKMLNLGVAGALLAVMNTASEVGFGNVIKTLPGFQTIASSLTRIHGGGPLLSEAITVNILAGITGSASGGMSIALETFGKEYLAWAGQIGMSPELLHRVASMASGGMDTLPHNGAVITLLAITGMTHRQSYKDIFAITLIKTGTVFLLVGAVSFY